MKLERSILYLETCNTIILEATQSSRIYSKNVRREKAETGFETGTFTRKVNSTVNPISIPP